MAYRNSTVSDSGEKSIFIFTDLPVICFPVSTGLFTALPALPKALKTPYIKMRTSPCQVSIPEISLPEIICREASPSLQVLIKMDFLFPGGKEKRYIPVFFEGENSTVMPRSEEHTSELQSHD